jgi:serine/threonine protein kinase
MAKPWTEEFAQKFLSLALKTISHLHSKGIIHGDLKPENILVRDKNPLSIALCDFGSSKSSAASQAITQITGSPLYLSPESALCTPSRQSDYYALGIILLEGLLGKHPLSHLDPKALFFHTASSKTIPLGPEVPQTWKPLLTGLLDPNPANRWGESELQNWIDTGKSTKEQPCTKTPSPFQEDDAKEDNLSASVSDLQEITAPLTPKEQTKLLNLLKPLEDCYTIAALAKAYQHIATDVLPSIRNDLTLSNENRQFLDGRLSQTLTKLSSRIDFLTPKAKAIVETAKKIKDMDLPTIYKLSEDDQLKVFQSLHFAYETIRQGCPKPKVRHIEAHIAKLYPYAHLGPGVTAAIQTLERTAHQLRTKRTRRPDFFTDISPILIIGTLLFCLAYFASKDYNGITNSQPPLLTEIAQSSEPAESLASEYAKFLGKLAGYTIIGEPLPPSSTYLHNKVLGKTTALQELYALYHENGLTLTDVGNHTLKSTPTSTQTSTKQEPKPSKK